MTTICLVRHGQTAWNKNHLIQGRKDFPLNKEGIKQAEQTATYLLNNDPNWDQIIVSPLIRAQKTAQIIAKTLNYQKPLITQDSLIEREFGEAEGLNICDEVYHHILLNEYPNLEKSYQLQARSKQAIIDIITAYPKQRILIVTHSHFIKGLLTKIIPGFTFTSTLGNASLTYLTFDEDKLFNALTSELEPVSYQLNIKP